MRERARGREREREWYVEKIINKEVEKAVLESWADTIRFDGIGKTTNSIYIELVYIVDL